MLDLKKISKKHFFQPVWYSLFINPYFIARYGLLKKIKVFAKQDFSGQKILDIGCGEGMLLREKASRSLLESKRISIF